MSKSIKFEPRKVGEIQPIKEKKFPIDRPVQLHVTADPLIHEGCVVAFFAPGAVDPVASFCISRAIGQTRLPKSIWVINRVKDLPDLKNRVKNPNFVRIEALRAEMRTKVLVDAGFLAVSQGGELILTAKTSIPLEGQKYRGYLDRAKNALDAEKAQAQTAWEEKYKSRPKMMRPKFVFVKTLDVFLSVEETHARGSINAALVELKFDQKAEEAFPDRHETMVDGMTPQRVFKPVAEDWGWYKPTSMLQECAQKFFLFAQGEHGQGEPEAVASLQAQVLGLKRALEKETEQVKTLKSGNADIAMSALQAEINRLQGELMQTAAQRDELEAHISHLHEQLREEEDQAAA